MVGVLTEDDDAGVGVRREVEGGEHLVGRRVDAVVLAFGADEACRSDQYGLSNSARSTGFQSVFAATPLLVRTPGARRRALAPRCCGVAVADRLDRVPRVALATLPTPLERGPELPGGARLWVKRDDLTGLGAGGNKARKLEFLCGEAVAAGAGRS